MGKSKETITIPVGGEINEGPDETSDSLINTGDKPLVATVEGKTKGGAMPISIKEVPDRILYYHRPPEKK